MDENKECVAEVVNVGNVSFLYLETEDGGRLVSASQIKSIFPDFRGPGGILFFTDSEKPIKIPQTPTEIVGDLIGYEDDETT